MIGSSMCWADLQSSFLPLHGSLDALDQVVYFKWLPEQAPCACGRGLSLQVRVQACRDQHNRGFRAPGRKALHEVQPANAGHMNVRYNAVERLMPTRANIVLSGGVSVGSIPERRQ